MIRNRRAFARIEWVIVVAIIGILAANATAQYQVDRVLNKASGGLALAQSANLALPDTCATYAGTPIATRGMNCPAPLADSYEPWCMTTAERVASESATYVWIAAIGPVITIPAIDGMTDGAITIGHAMASGAPAGAILPLAPATGTVVGSVPRQLLAPRIALVWGCDANLGAVG